MTVAVPERHPPAITTTPLRRHRRHLPSGLRVLPDEARSMGLSVWATRGAGKSRMLGRLIGWQDFFQGVPLVILDPIGGTIDNFLDKVSRRPPRERAALWTRIRYVNMNGQDGRVVPWPIYRPAHAGERASATAQRYVDVLTRADPNLARAPIQGLNALAPLANAAGLVLSALGLGITEAWSLVSEPGRWQTRLTRLATERPELAGATGELHTLFALSPRERENRAATFKSKLSLFRFAPNFRAIFGAKQMGISWPAVVTHRQAILLDFRDIHSPQLKKFCLLWVYHSLVTFIKQRGHGRQIPISLIIDELSYLVGTAADNTDLLTADLDELINRISRSHRIWLTLAGQELFQLPEQLRQTVLSTGAVIFGQTSDYQAAEELARRYYTYNPYRVKKAEPIQGVVEPAGTRYRGSPTVYGTIAIRTTEFTRDEQNYLHSRNFLQLPAFHFLLGQSPREGQLPTHLQPITTGRLDAGQFPDKKKVDRIRSELMRRDGVSEQAILAEIQTRLASPPHRVSTDRAASPSPAGAAASEAVPPEHQSLKDRPIGRYHPDEE